MCTVNETGRLLQVNYQFCGLLGYTGFQLQQKPLSGLIHPEDRELLTITFKDLLKREAGNCRIQTRLVHLGGRSIPVHMRISIMRSGESLTPRFVIHVDDLIKQQPNVRPGKETERIANIRRTELDPQFGASLLHSIYDETLEGILVIDNQGFIVSINKRFQEIWDPSRTIQVDDRCSEKIVAVEHPLLSKVIDSVENSQALTQRILERRSNLNEDAHFEITLKDSRAIEIHSKCLRNQEGNQLGQIWFFRHINLEKHA